MSVAYVGLDCPTEAYATLAMIPLHIESELTANSWKEAITPCRIHCAA